MAKRKKKSTRVASLGFGSKNLDSELKRAEKYVAKEDWSTAINILLPLSEQYPDERHIWELLNYLSYETDNMPLYQKSCEGWLKVQPNNIDVIYGLGGAYLANAHPLMALQTFRQALAVDPDHEFAEEARTTVKELEELAERLVEEIGLTGEAGWETAVLHEQGQAYLESGNYAAAREAENEVLKRNPEFVSARNNLSLISWQEGKVDEAIATAQAALEETQDNVHALSNLVHFLVVNGDDAAARPYGDRLKVSQAQGWDTWTKKVEGLSYLRDDAAVVEVWEQAKAAKAEAEDGLSPMFFHLAGVALARLNRKDEAVAQWETAVKLYDTYPLAQENLTDIRHTVDLRHGAWPFFWQQWLLPGVAEDFLQTISTSLQSKQREKNLDKNLQQYLEHHPDFLRKTPILLERGGPPAQELILNLAEQLRLPELLAAIKDFALGQNGIDQIRYRAAVLASQENLIPKKVTLWLQGEWREVQLMAYEFHSDPPIQHSKAVEELLAEAIYLLREMDDAAAQEAEALLRQALEKEPDAPDILNNLSKALEIQGRTAEAIELREDILERFPDYLFARMSKAAELIDAGDLEAAAALLLPLLERERFHFLEFGAFSDAYLLLLTAQKEWEKASKWFEMWDQVDPENPRLDYWAEEFDKHIWLPKS